MTLAAAAGSVPIKTGARAGVYELVGDQTQMETQNRCSGDKHMPQG